MEQIVIDCNVNNWWDTLSDEEFQLTFRISRQNFTALQAELDNLENKEVPTVDKQLLAILWVVGNTTCIDEANQLFGLEDIQSSVDEYAKKIISLGKTYLSWPTVEEFAYIENSFASEYKFPGVIGVIGSLYIEVQASKSRTKNQYYNEETKKHMIVLQIVCDNNLLIRDVAVGFPGGKTVEDILKSSPLYRKLIDPNGYLFKNNKHLLGGYKHPELKTLLTPYDLKGKNIDRKKLSFNELHESVMKTVEETFRCIEIRFPRTTSMEIFEPKFASLLLSAICVLHNFNRIKADSY